MAVPGPESEWGAGGREGGGEAGNFLNTTVVSTLHADLGWQLLYVFFFSICADEASTLYLFLEKKKEYKNIDR